MAIDKAKNNDELVGTLDDAIIESLKTQGIIIPETDFWTKDEKRLLKNREGTVVLYINRNVESRFAAMYANQAGIDFKIFLLEKDYLCENHIEFGKVLVPCLVDARESKSYFPWDGLMNVKLYLRRELGKQFDLKMMHADKLTGSEEIVYFDKTGKEVYNGSLNSAPHPANLIRNELARHWYDQWNELFCQEIGDWNALLNVRGKDGEIIDIKTGVILFADEVEQLRMKKRAVTLADSSYMNVDFICYFVDDENKLFKFDASEID